MTATEAKRKQTVLEADGFKLCWWYGTGCKKCCGVYPRFRTTYGLDQKCWYECDVCGKRTAPKIMPWIAADAWNNEEFLDGIVQLSLF